MQQEPSTFEKLVRIQESFYDKGMTYSKVLLGLGYAGIFTVLSATKQYLQPRRVLWCALLVSVSLISYVLFEVFHMLLLAWNGVSLANAMNKSGGNHEKAAREYAVLVTSRNEWLLWPWVITICVCLPTGLAAAGLLIYTFLQRAWLGN